MRSEESGWEALFWGVFDRTTNPIAVLDDELRFVAVNKPALGTLGQTRGFLMGRRSLDVIAADQRPRAEQEWSDLLQSGELSTETTVLHSNGTRMNIEVAARQATVGGRLLVVFVVTEVRQPGTAAQPSEADPATLTQREREVVTLIALGEDTAGISEQLTISPATTRTHVRNAMRKLGVRTRAQLVAVTLASGAITALPRGK